MTVREEGPFARAFRQICVVDLPDLVPMPGYVAKNVTIQKAQNSVAVN
jgi:hypothetical protein